MAKKIDPKSLIHFELSKLEDKVHEFQKYLELNTIISKVGVRIDELELADDQQDKLHKEIVIQIKMQDALFNWMPILEKLRDTSETKELQTRGDVEVNGMFKNKNL